MKIQLQNISFYPATGGIENYLYYASKTLLKMGYEPTILCSQHQPDLPAKEVYEGIKIIRHPRYHFSKPFAPANPIYYAKKLNKFIENNVTGCDAIWSRFYYYSYASGKSFQNKIPIIYIQPVVAPLYLEYESSNWGLVGKIYSKIIKPQIHFIEKRAMEMCDKIVVLSEIRMREISDFYKFPKEKIEVVPPGIDLERFTPNEKNKYLLKELNLPENAKVVLTVCRLSPEKNISMLIKAFAKINLMDAYLVIVGDGQERAYLEQLTRKLNITKKVRFVGFRKDIERFYSIADVFVHPSKYEGFGHVYLEAMASGVPCIGLKSDYPNIIVASEEIIRDGRTGYLADPYSIDDLVVKIEKIISDEKAKEKMGRKSREVAKKEYSWNSHVMRLIKLSKE